MYIYLYTDVIKSNVQEKIRYKDRRLQKGLAVSVDINTTYVHFGITNGTENSIIYVLCSYIINHKYSIPTKYNLHNEQFIQLIMLNKYFPNYSTENNHMMHYKYKSNMSL